MNNESMTIDEISSTLKTKLIDSNSKLSVLANTLLTIYNSNKETLDQLDKIVLLQEANTTMYLSEISKLKEYIISLTKEKHLLEEKIDSLEKGEDMKENDLDIVIESLGDIITDIDDLHPDDEKIKQEALKHLHSFEEPEEIEVYKQNEED